MVVIRRWLAGVLAVLMLAVASTPLWWTMPVPSHALIIDQARYTAPERAPETLGLPHAQSRRHIEGQYHLTFDLAQASTQPLYLFIPMFSYRAIVALDGETVMDTGAHSLVPGVMLGASTLVPLSGGTLAAGRHTIDIRLRAQGIARGYLSAVYIGTAQQLAPYHRLRMLVLEHMRMMVLACQLLLLVATLMVWAYRPRESLYGWLFLLLAVSTASYVGLLADIVPDLPDWLPYAFTISMSGVFILHVIALRINGTVAPVWLRACVAGVPGACLLAMGAGLATPTAVMMGVVTPVMVVSPLITVAIAAWGALVKKVWEAWLLLLPLSAFSLAILHDGAVVAGFLDGPVFLSLYYRQLLLLAIAVILMRRLGLSLIRLDGANVHLKRKLAEREAELHRLYEEERGEAAHRVRAEERHRLTEDLHDGLSGHLASIIAMAERDRATDIERTAREALDDLRLVIHSLDIGDRELMAALSGLRERLEPRLKRQGVLLEWSMARLPEISGVTPEYALNTLRIVQEAVTNALRHGPATRIAVRGDTGSHGEALITVENDGAPYAPGPGGGAGLQNMSRRAAFLKGALQIEALPAGTRVTLTLPIRPDGGTGSAARIGYVDAQAYAR